MLTDFIIIGTQKGGTTSLSMTLQNHSHIDMPKGVSEIVAFDNEVNCNKWHSTAYPSKRNNSKILSGHKKPLIMMKQEWIKNIYNHNPNCKLIASLRNPVDRFWSHFYMNNGEKNKDYESFINNKKHMSLDRGLYLEQIKFIHSIFPKEQLLILKFEDLPNSLPIIQDFLNIPHELKSLKHSRKGKINKHIDTKTNKFLIDFYKKPNQELFKYLGWDKNTW